MKDYHKYLSLFLPHETHGCPIANDNSSEIENTIVISNISNNTLDDIDEDINWNKNNKNFNSEWNKLNKGSFEMNNININLNLRLENNHLASFNLEADRLKVFFNKLKM